MPKLELAELIEATAGTLLQGDSKTVVDSFVMNTRALHKGGLFFALPGNRRDGHRFLSDAAKKGGAAAMIMNDPQEGKRTPDALIRVEDTLTALGQAGCLARKKLADTKTICITGSNGKTTTKELLAAGLGGIQRVHRSRGNFNNHIGVPLSLLACPDDAEVMVLELGMSAAGEIAHLAEMTIPDIALITTIREVHLQYFNSLDDIAAAKGELFALLGEDATAVVNLDDPHIRVQAARHAGRRVTFGQHPEADLSIDTIVNQFTPGTTFNVQHAGKSYPIQLKLGGAHSAFNCVSALATCVAAGAELEAVIPGMEQLEPVPGRGMVYHLKNGATVIDDSYNSSPSALACVLETFQLSKPAGRKILVMGDMLELGSIEGALHRAAGKRAATTGVSYLVAVGPLSRQTAESARRSGVAEVHQFTDSTKAAEPLLDALCDGDLVVVKGSRGMKMERVVDALLDHFGEQR